ncbi:universal stress protein a-like protein, partial [Plakobranchus ocellatus]
MVDGMFSVIHGKNVWSLKSMFRRAMTLGTEERSVVLAVDDSSNAEYAFDWYVTHFHKPETRMYLVHCPETYANVTMMSPGKVQELIKECEAKIKSIESKYLAKMKASGIQGEFIRLHGEKPGHAIIDCATTKNATFIVT